MTLTQKLRTWGYAALLALTPASCGDLLACKIDKDCNEGRICEPDKELDNIFRCMTIEEAAEQGNLPENNSSTCGDSPFIWHNLRNVSMCTYGTPEPLKDDCTGGMATVGDDFNAERRPTRFTYFGNTLTFLEEFYQPFYQLLDQPPSREELPTFEFCHPWVLDEDQSPEVMVQNAYERAMWEVDMGRLYCYFENEGPDFFMGKTERICNFHTFFRKMPANKPWLNKEQCLAEEVSQPMSRCIEELPYPEEQNN